MDWIMTKKRWFYFGIGCFTHIAAIVFSMFEPAVAIGLLIVGNLALFILVIEKINFVKEEPWEYKKPSKIFVCSIADLFAPWTPEDWRNQVLDSIENCPTRHTFQLLTKNPELIPNS